VCQEGCGHTGCRKRTCASRGQRAKAFNRWGERHMWDRWPIARAVLGAVEDWSQAALGEEWPQRTRGS
jgi:hypothetical protein